MKNNKKQEELKQNSEGTPKEFMENNENFMEKVWKALQVDFEEILGESQLQEKFYRGVCSFDEMLSKLLEN